MVSANVAKCVYAMSYEFDGNQIQSPYQCDPTDISKKCRVYVKTEAS